MDGIVKRDCSWEGNSEITSSDYEGLKKLVKLALSETAIVLVEGKCGTGKTRLLSRLFPEENILAAKSKTIGSGKLDIKAIDRWKARIGSVAIDETDWLSREQFDSLIESAVNGKKGIALAVQSIERYKEKILKIKNDYGISVLAIVLTKYNFDDEISEWSHYL
mgnify:CR=1 FL=1